MIKNTFLAILSTLATVTPSLAYTQSEFQDHVRLRNKVVETGVTFRLNPSRCDNDGDGQMMGWYFAPTSNYRELVICQENRVKGSTNQVSWTDEDLDTLRHESWHLVQDCRDGKLNSRLHTVYNDPLKLGYNTIGKRNMVNINEVYGSKGSHVVTIEIEAFSVASMNRPNEIINDINTYCLGR